MIKVRSWDSDTTAEDSRSVGRADKRGALHGTWNKLTCVHKKPEMHKLVHVIDATSFDLSRFIGWPSSFPDPYSAHLVRNVLMKNELKT